MLRVKMASVVSFILFVAAPASAIRFGVQIAPENATYEEMVETWRVIEELGYDGAWLNDHFIPIMGDKDEPQLRVVDAAHRAGDADASASAWASSSPATPTGIPPCWRRWRRRSTTSAAAG